MSPKERNGQNRSKAFYTCDYCKRPIICYGHLEHYPQKRLVESHKEGAQKKTRITKSMLGVEKDGPTVRPRVTRWCDGTCDWIMAELGFLPEVIRKASPERLKKRLDRLSKEVCAWLIHRDKDGKERAIGRQSR